jgi:hypothetical protein
MKHWMRSKTLWVNGIVATLLLAETNIQSLQGLLPAWAHQSLIFGLPIVNMWLRMTTTQGLSFKPQMPKGEADQ